MRFVGNQSWPGEVRGRFDNSPFLTGVFMVCSRGVAPFPQGLGSRNLTQRREGAARQSRIQRILNRSFHELRSPPRMKTPCGHRALGPQQIVVSRPLEGIFMGANGANGEEKILPKNAQFLEMTGCVRLRSLKYYKTRNRLQQTWQSALRRGSFARLRGSPWKSGERHRSATVSTGPVAACEHQ